MSNTTARRLAPILAFAVAAILIISLIGMSSDRPATTTKQFSMPPSPPAAQPELPPAPQFDSKPAIAPPPIPLPQVPGYSKPSVR